MTKESNDQPTFLTDGDPVADLPMFITTTRNFEPFDMAPGEASSNATADDD